MTFAAIINRSPKLRQATESIDANVGPDVEDDELLANINYQRDVLGLSDRQVAILMHWYGFTKVTRKD